MQEAEQAAPVEDVSSGEAKRQAAIEAGRQATQMAGGVAERTSTVREFSTDGTLMTPRDLAERQRGTDGKASNAGGRLAA